MGCLLSHYYKELEEPLLPKVISTENLKILRGDFDKTPSPPPVFLYYFPKSLLDPFIEK